MSSQESRLHPAIQWCMYIHEPWNLTEKEIEQCGEWFREAFKADIKAGLDEIDAMQHKKE